jgi:AbrB family looped-hinge helix DNA binding protein
MPDDPIVAVTRVSGKGLVLIPLEIREKLDLQPGTKLNVVAAEDAVVLRNVRR